MNDDLLNRYSRHILLDDIGVAGQTALQQARVLVVGAGGLGCAAALYLAAAGVGELTICDDDAVDLTICNGRYCIPRRVSGDAKVLSAQTALNAVNPHCQVFPVGERLNAANAESIIAKADVVVDGSDNYETRHRINRVCVRLKKPLIFGAALSFDGQAAVFDGRQSDSPCYNCLFSENDKAPETACALMGVFAPLTGIIGCIQAAEAIKVLAIPQGRSLVGRLLLIDARAMRIREVRMPKDPSCAVCQSV